MRYNSAQCIIAFMPLFRATGQTPEEKLSALVAEFFNEYTDVQLLNARKCAQFLNEGECQKEEGCVDLKNIVEPLLSSINERFWPARNVPCTAWDVDLDIIQRQFQELVDTGILHRDVLIYKSTDNPELKQIDAGSKKELNICLMIFALACYYSRHSGTVNFFTVLRDAVINDFRILGVGGSGLRRVVERTNGVLQSLKAASEELQTFIGRANKNLSHNIEVLIGLPSDQRGVLSNIKLRLLCYRCTEAASSDVLLDDTKLLALSNSLDSMYLNEHAPAILELFCSCFLLLVIEFERSGDLLNCATKNHFIKTFSDITLLSLTSVLFYDLPSIAKLREVRFRDDFCNEIFIGMRADKVFKDILHAIKDCYSRDSNVTRCEAIQAAMSKAQGTLSQILALSASRSIQKDGTPVQNKLVCVEKRLLLSMFDMSEYPDMDRFLHEIEALSGSADLKALYVHGICHIVHAITAGKTSGGIIPGDMMVAESCLRAGGRNTSVLSAADKMKKILKIVSLSGKELGDISKYKIFAVILLAVLVILDLILLVACLALPKDQTIKANTPKSRALKSDV